MVSVYGIRNDIIIPKELLEKLLPLVSENTKSRVSKFYHLEDKQRTILGEILARYVIQKHHSLLNKNIIFERDQYGKPFLRGFKNIHFNISHSGSWVVCSLSCKPIGIDVEKINEIDFDVGKMIFSAVEFDVLCNMPESLKLNYFYSIWSLKESYIKALGKGFSIPTQTFSIRLHEKDIFLEYSPYQKECFFRQYPIDKNYFLSVCSFEKELSDYVIVVDLQELLKLD